MEKVNQVKKIRDSSLDIIRIVAFFSVVSVHFFKDNGFYSQIVQGGSMYIATTMRTAFMVCVPLFLILTGYLMNKKTLSKQYYTGLIKTLEVYAAASLVCLIFKIVYLGNTYTLQSIIRGFFEFSIASYSWYVEMYIGLYIMIPFLNILYNNLSKAEKRILIIIFLLLTSIPGVVNLYCAVLPDWWVNVYPVTYYFIGCYVYEFYKRNDSKKYIPVYMLSILLFGTLNYYLSYGKAFVKGAWQTWGALPNVIMTVLLFLILLGVKGNNYPEIVKYWLKKISGWCFGAYLLSCIFDAMFYPYLNAAIPEMTMRLKYYVIIVPAVFVCSLLLSAAVNFVLGKMHDVINKFLDFNKGQ